MEKVYEIKSELHTLPSRRLPVAVHRPVEKTERSRIAVLGVHTGHYILSFAPLVELAKRGYVTIGAPQLKDKGIKERMLDVKAAVEFARSCPGVEKVVLFGHSQGGCILSCYQYIAENGTARFVNSGRFLPFPEIEPLPPADGLMLVDTNYGIMDVLAMDPAVKDWHSGFERIPELDIYNPENGYKPGESRYTKEFIDRFQKAQVKFYQDILDYAKQRYEDIKKGKASFADDEPIVIAGAGGGSSNNKLFIQDNSLLAHTRNEHLVLRNGGAVTKEIARTVRIPEDAVPSKFYVGGADTTSVMKMLEFEYRFGDFGYDECSMWGVDWDFNPFSSQANVKGISVPLLCQGNLGSHEFINIEYSYDNAKSQDKTAVFVDGSTHGFTPVESAEKFPGEFGDPAVTFAEFAAEWLCQEGRFIG
ncbi:MAG: alpha/beta hydrolase [Oscillospiraceae bacterium]